MINFIIYFERCACITVPSAFRNKGNGKWKQLCSYYTDNGLNLFNAAALAVITTVQIHNKCIGLIIFNDPLLKF